MSGVEQWQSEAGQGGVGRRVERFVVIVGQCVQQWNGKSARGMGKEENNRCNRVGQREEARPGWCGRGGQQPRRRKRVGRVGAHPTGGQAAAPSHAGD